MYLDYSFLFILFIFKYLQCIAYVQQANAFEHSQGLNIMKREAVHWQNRGDYS